MYFRIALVPCPIWWIGYLEEAVQVRTEQRCSKRGLKANPLREWLKLPPIYFYSFTHPDSLANNPPGKTCDFRQKETGWWRLVIHDSYDHGLCSCCPACPWASKRVTITIESFEGGSELFDTKSKLPFWNRILVGIRRQRGQWFTLLL